MLTTTPEESSPIAGSSPPSALATKGNVSTDALIARAKHLQRVNCDFLQELTMLRSEEHTRRANVLSVDYPLVRRWCQEADEFLDQMQHIDDFIDEGGVSTASVEIGTRKLVKKRLVLFEDTVGPHIKALQQLHSGKGTTSISELMLD